VVSPSRSRLPMPALPRPVPAAIGWSSLQRVFLFLVSWLVLDAPAQF
jgi:hypothetical protein